MAAGRLQQLQLILRRCTSLDTHQIHSGVVQITPEVSQFDQKVHIRVQGLSKHAKVTLFAITENEWQRQPVQFVSCGQYLTNQAGEVDLEKDASVGGTYTGVEPMGLFWSMIPKPSGPKNIRLVVKNVEQPVVYRLSVYQDHLTLDNIVGEKNRYQPLSTHTVQRVVMSPHVRRIPVKEGTVRGMLFLPPGEGPFPGVLDMFGMAGGLMEARAALLASHGFAAFALPFYRYEDLPDNIYDQTFAHFENAVSWFASHPSVRPGGIGVVGVSGGAGYGLMMAYKCPEVKALVRINGPAFHSMMDDGHTFTVGLQSDLSKRVVTEEGLVLRRTWIFEDKDAIPLWKKDVHTMVLMSDDDGQVDPSYMDQVHQMYPEDRRHLMEVVHYPGAGHLLEPPYTPLCRACYNPFFKMDLVWGGYPREHAAAQEDSWKKILQFFQKHLPSSH